jgi:hypothetical protein
MVPLCLIGSHSSANTVAAGEPGWFVPFSDNNEGLYSCVALATEQLNYLVDTANGVCTSHCFTHHALCCHIFAAIELSHMPEDMRPDVSEEIEFVTRRRRRRAMLHGGEEPCITAATELPHVRQVQISAGKHALSAAVKQAAAVCDRVKAMIKELPADHAAIAKAKLQDVLESLQGLRQGFSKTTMAAAKQERRQLSRKPQSRIVQPLQPGRRKSTLHVVLEEDEGGEAGAREDEDQANAMEGSSADGGQAGNLHFAGSPARGRPCTSARGMGGLNRTKKSGGKRTGRKQYK